jgi:hypothetical protein
MRTNDRVLALFVGLALVLTAAPSTSRAAIVETIVDTDFNAVVGSITFPGLDGSSDAGVLLSFAGYTQADITSISWNLDPATLSVTALDLSALQGTPGCGVGQNCSENTLHLSPTISQRTAISCFTVEGDLHLCAIGLIPDENIAFVLTSVPEPSTWAMMLLGFAGLGFAGYRSSRNAASIAA